MITMNSALVFSDNVKRGQRPLSSDPKQIQVCHYVSSARLFGTLHEMTLNALFISVSPQALWIATFGSDKCTNS